MLPAKFEKSPYFLNTPRTLIVSYGFDGSTGQSIYKQPFEQSETVGLDQSLFVTSNLEKKVSCVLME